MNWYENRKDFFYKEQKTIDETYPSLHFWIKEGKMHLSGELYFRAIYNNEAIEDTYDIDIQFPDDYPDGLPVVWEVSGKIDKEYHRFLNETLCLGTFVKIYKVFQTAPNIRNFIESLLIPYLYRYSYLKKYKKAPFPDAEHGVLGIIQWYQSYFELHDVRKIFEFLLIVIEDKYKGQLRCPCGSRKRLRNCHGPKLIQLLTVPKKYLRLEASSILDYILEVNKKLRIRSQLEMFMKVQTTK